MGVDVFCSDSGIRFWTMGSELFATLLLEGQILRYFREIQGIKKMTGNWFVFKNEFKELFA